MNQLRNMQDTLKFSLMRLTYVTDDAIATHARDVERALNRDMRVLKKILARETKQQRAQAGQ